MQKEIHVAPDHVLLTRDNIHNLAKALAARNLSRGKTVDFLADTIFGFEGVIYDGEGVPIIIHDEIVDHSFGKDHAFTWNSAVKRFADVPPERRPRQSLKLRLQLFDAAFKILNTPLT